MNAFKSIPGTFDILPDGYSNGGDEVAPVRMWLHLEETVRSIMARYGAEEIRTPILEPTELIARGIGALTDIVTKEMFAFERGSTNYVMRPEVTAPVMRAYLQHNLEQRGGTQRLFYIGPCFRAERPQKGRYRQFHQFGLELIGSEDPRADAETIVSLRDVLEGLGLSRYTLRLNSLGDEQSRPAFKRALVDFLTPLADQLSEISRNRLASNPLRILDTKIDTERTLLADAPRLSDFIDEASRDHHAMVKSLLDAAGLAYVEDPFLVRGLDYYSRTAFEFESPLLGAQSSIAGGGRYDLLSKEVGSKQAVPAVGFAAGMERILLACAAEQVAMPAEPRVDVFIVALGDASAAWAFAEAGRLRGSGLKVAYDMKGRSMKAQMREANRQRARFVAIVGDDELVQGVVQLKDMDGGNQETVSPSAIAGRISAAI
ncbi:MAG: histidine--tRNA ligase [Bacteroidetes bacterium]|nr:histidine--tRNA ligase [Bacteroidota bacterium]